MFNYIKAHRRNWGLTQKELGYIIGNDNHVRVSQIERGKKKPNLTEAVIFELLFDKSISRLFPDVYHNITKTLRSRLKLLEEHFSELQQTKQTERILKRIYEVREELKYLNDQRI